MAAEINTSLQKKILETLPGAVGSVLKQTAGKGPDRQKIHFWENDIIVNLYGFINKALARSDYLTDRQLMEAVRNYHYNFTKADIKYIRKVFRDNYNLQVRNVFCDFDVAADEGVFIFRCE